MHINQQVLSIICDVRFVSNGDFESDRHSLATIHRNNAQISSSKYLLCQSKSSKFCKRWRRKQYLPEIKMRRLSRLLQEVKRPRRNSTLQINYINILFIKRADSCFGPGR